MIEGEKNIDGLTRFKLQDEEMIKANFDSSYDGVENYQEETLRDENGEKKDRRHLQEGERRLAPRKRQVGGTFKIKETDRVEEETSREDDKNDEEKRAESFGTTREG